MLTAEHVFDSADQVFRLFNIIVFLFTEICNLYAYL
jgi:hypothetical protein